RFALRRLRGQCRRAVGGVPPACTPPRVAKNVASPPQPTRKRDRAPLAVQYDGVSGCSTVDCKGIPYIIPVGGSPGNDSDVGGITPTRRNRMSPGGSVDPSVDASACRQARVGVAAVRN